MKKLWVASMVLASSSTYAASFNCQQASTPVEHMICDTPRLSSLDETLNDTYSTALTGSPENASGLKAVQRQWITMRNKLTTVKQLELAYGIQISGLKSLSSVTSDASETPTSKPVTNMDTKKASESSPADEVPATHNQSKQQISNLTLESFKKSFIQDREGEYHSTTSMPEG